MIKLKKERLDSIEGYLLGIAIAGTIGLSTNMLWLWLQMNASNGYAITIYSNIYGEHTIETILWVSLIIISLAAYILYVERRRGM